MKNNLFNYATSELSQDAFICWLMSYAMPDAKQDDPLRKCAVTFIKEFIPRLKKEADKNIFVTDIKKQYGKIDVLLTVNDTYKVIVEDKTFTYEHNNQLKNYKDFLINEGINSDKIYCVYYKTGFQGDLSNVIKENYTIFDRKRILSILNSNSAGITNDIFIDYLDYYNTFEKKVQSYRTTPVSDWNYLMIQGFFDDLKSNSELYKGIFDGDFNYDYIPNRSGGFYGMWLFANKKLYFGKIKFSPYLQIEALDKNKSSNYGSINICFKLSVENKEKNFKPNILRDLIVYNNTTEWKYNLEQFGYYKPKRLAQGSTMTLGNVWKQAQSSITFEDVLYEFQKSINNFPAIMEYIQKKIYN